VHRPRVLLLDEPASGLDPRSRVELRDLLRGLAAQGAAVLVSSHILTELQEIADRVVLVASGRTLGEHTMMELSAQVRAGYRVRAQDASALASALGVRGIAESGNGTGNGIELPPMSEDEAADLLTGLVGAGVRVVAFEPVGGSLESIYMAMTEERR
jgi:ABC-2 type transport system ATP-binding protein